MRRSLALASLLVAASLAGCGSSGGDAPAGSASASPSAIAAKGPVVAAAEEAAPTASSSAEAAPEPTVPIPAGKLVAGSVPGDLGRDAVLEPAELEVELGAFDVDRLPYPNELGKPPKLGVTRSEAGKLCEARGRRLCTELEWERACKGPEQTPYPGGAGADPRCASEPEKCASGFGVLAMGSLREWTASDVAEVAGLVPRGAAVRGAGKGAADVDRRCAKRASVSPESENDDVGFRCCGGERNAATIAAPEKKPVWQKTKLPAETLAEMLSTVPQLRKLTGPPKYFDEAVIKDVLTRGKVEDTPGYTLTTEPLLWRPVPGEEVLLVTVRMGSDTVIVAFHRLPGDRHRLASSFVLKNEPAAAVLAYDTSVDNRLEWSTCWRCPGEGGRITFRDRGRVVITQE
jgi:hypothetical protein